MSVEGTSTGWIDRLERSASDAPSVRLGSMALGASTLGHAARVLDTQLSALDLTTGDLVAVLAPPSLEGVALIHALLDRGIVLLPLNARLAEPEQVLALRASGARVLIVSAAEHEEDRARALRLVGYVGCGLLELGTVAGEDVALARVAAPASEREEDFASRRRRRREEGAALVLRTSGTSGDPKGAVLGLDNLIASAEGSARLLGSAASDRWLLCMPLFHIGGLSILIRAALAGATVVLHERFDEGLVARALEHEGITHVSFVATMLERVLGARGERPAPETLSLVLLGGGPASERLLRRAQALGYPIAPTYGLTEAASQVATRPPGAPALSEDPAGGLVPLPGVGLRVIDPGGSPVPTNTEGEIQVRGPTVMRGYLDDTEATRDAFIEGWLSTGDIGRLDGEGRLRVVDRRADLIVSGGENVYPAEVEDALAEHPDVVEAGVRGVPDEVFGSRPAAWVVLREGAAFSPEGLAEYCRERLAAYKCPVAIARVSSLPHNTTGKLIRRWLGDDENWR